VGIHTIPMREFLDVTERWLVAVEEQDVGRAQILSERLKQVGELLAIDPDFRRMFLETQDNCGTTDPGEALRCVYAFFSAINRAAKPGAFRAERR
jgi:hypothetical protein